MSDDYSADVQTTGAVAVGGRPCDRTTGVGPRRAAGDQAVIVLLTKYNSLLENKLYPF